MVDLLFVLNTKAIQLPALALKCVDDVECCNSLALGVLRVGDRVADDVLEEHLENTSCFLVDEAADALDATTACQTADRRPGDALDVVAQDRTMAHGAALPEARLSLSATGHAAKVFTMYHSLFIS
jgi:hypothetical protein